MPTVPDAPVAGVLYSTASIQKLVTAIIELQGAGVLATSTNATTSTTAGPATITQWDGTSITLASTRKIIISTSGLLNGTVVGIVGTINLTLGTQIMKIQVECAQTSGGIDINQQSVMFQLAAGTYTMAATLTRAVTAGTIAFAGTGNIMQIIDMGPA